MRRFAETLDADPRRRPPSRRLDRLADVRRRHGAATYDELLERRVAAVAELERAGAEGDPPRARAPGA